MSQTVLNPTEVESDARLGRWVVTIFNNDYNTVEEVVYILIKATGCSMEEAEIEMWEAHTFGQTGVHYDSRENCDDVARVIESIGVKTQVTPEWVDG